MVLQESPQLDVNVKDGRDWTSLMNAAYTGRVDVTKLLLAKGADVHATDKKGNTALAWARTQEKTLKDKEAAAEVVALLEAAAEDLEFAGGEIRVKGAPGLSVGLREVAEAASGVPGYALPPGVEPGLESSVNFMPTGLAYSNSVHAAEVEVDIETGYVAIRRAKRG